MIATLLIGCMIAAVIVAGMIAPNGEEYYSEGKRLMPQKIFNLYCTEDGVLMYTPGVPEHVVCISKEDYLEGRY